MATSDDSLGSDNGGDSSDAADSNSSRQAASQQASTEKLHGILYAIWSDYCNTFEDTERMSLHVAMRSILAELKRRGQPVTREIVDRLPGFAEWYAAINDVKNVEKFRSLYKKK